eukprot:748309-Hanusia_phi.AAC.9
MRENNLCENGRVEGGGGGDGDGRIREDKAREDGILVVRRARGGRGDGGRGGGDGGWGEARGVRHDIDEECERGGGVNREQPVAPALGS